MKNLIKLICIVVLFLSVNSCGVSWQIQSVNQAAQVDTLYDVDVITSRSQLDWKMQRDWTFANNYYRFLQVGCGISILIMVIGDQVSGTIIRTQAIGDTLKFMVQELSI